MLLTLMSLGEDAVKGNMEKVKYCKKVLLINRLSFICANKKVQASKR
jgi:hypothetical protein